MPTPLNTKFQRNPFTTSGDEIFVLTPEAISPFYANEIQNAILNWKRLERHVRRNSTSAPVKLIMKPEDKKSI